VIFAEALISGMIPTWSSSCRESPKVLGIANSFAGGVFLAIAFMHITPEMIETWDGLPVNEGKEKIFPLPELLIFCGYTFILVIDKVLFDTHALFEHDHGDGHHESHDPAAVKLEINLKASMAKSAALATGGNVKASRIVEKEGTEGAMKSYLNPHDRFATRMKASMTGKVEADSHQNDEQNALFVDGAQIAVDDVDKGKYLPLS
jgi:zinc transporter ZupT